MGTTPRRERRTTAAVVAYQAPVSEEELARRETERVAWEQRVERRAVRAEVAALLDPANPVYDPTWDVEERRAAEKDVRTRRDAAVGRGASSAWRAAWR